MANVSDDLRRAMRQMAGGVSVITAGAGDERTGLTAITARSLSIDPPRMLVCVSASASTWPVIRKYRHFAVNMLAAHQRQIAERFAGCGGVKGVDRYSDATWTPLASGASGLACALAVVDCRVEEISSATTMGSSSAPCSRRRSGRSATPIPCSMPMAALHR